MKNFLVGTGFVFLMVLLLSLGIIMFSSPSSISPEKATLLVLVFGLLSISCFLGSISLEMIETSDTKRALEERRERREKENSERNEYVATILTQWAEDRNTGVKK